MDGLGIGAGIRTCDAMKGESTFCIAEGDSLTGRGVVTARFMCDSCG